MKSGKERSPTIRTNAVLWWSSAIIGIAFLIALYFYLVPPPPEKWGQVKLGMSKEQVNQLVPGIHYAKPENYVAGAEWRDGPKAWDILLVFHEDRLAQINIHYYYSPWKWLGRPLITVNRSNG